MDMQEKSGYLRLGQVLELIPMCRSKWYQGMKEGIFPKPVKIGRSSFFVKAEILDLMERFQAARGERS